MLFFRFGLNIKFVLLGSINSSTSQLFINIQLTFYCLSFWFPKFSWEVVPTILTASGLCTLIPIQHSINYTIPDIAYLRYSLEFSQVFHFCRYFIHLALFIRRNTGFTSIPQDQSVHAYSSWNSGVASPGGPPY